MAAREDAARLANRSCFTYAPRDLKRDPPTEIAGKDLVRWKYQRYKQDYLACVQSIDDNVGRLLDFLRQSGLERDTIAVYTSDRGK